MNTANFHCALFSLTKTPKRTFIIPIVSVTNNLAHMTKFSQAPHVLLSHCYSSKRKLNEQKSDISPWNETLTTRKLPTTV